MPIACLGIDFESGTKRCFPVENHPSVNYQHLTDLLHTIVKKQQPKSVPTLDRTAVKSLLGFCQSDIERACV